MASSETARGRRPLTIVADDLTGAADCAVGLGRGSPVPVVWEGAGRRGPLVAVDTDSRWRPAGEAARLVAAVVAATAPAARLYKKIDSTVRGPVAAEVLAATRTRALRLGPQVAVVAPAYPALGRTVVDGVVRVHGEPHADAAALFGPATYRVGLAEVGRGPRYLIEVLAGTAAEVVVVDAVTAEHLAIVAAAVDALPDRVVGVGSGGLARHLTPPELPVELPPGPVAGPVVIVVGSFAAVAREQAARVATRAGVVLAVPDPTAVRRAVAAGHDVLMLADGAGQAAPDAADRTVAHRLARAVVAGTRGLAVGAVIATGGDTARAWLSAVGASMLLVRGEPVPGVVFGTTDVPGAPPLVSKAGSFGGPDTLAGVLDLLRGETT